MNKDETFQRRLVTCLKTSQCNIFSSKVPHVLIFGLWTSYFCCSKIRPFLLLERPGRWGLHRACCVGWALPRSRIFSPGSLNSGQSSSSSSNFRKIWNVWKILENLKVSTVKFSLAHITSNCFFSSKILVSAFLSTSYQYVYLFPCVLKFIFVSICTSLYRQIPS